MNFMSVWRATAVVAIVLASTGEAWTQPPAQTRVEGLIHDYTVPLDNPWEIVGEWSLAVNTASGKVDFVAVLNMVRAENADRQAHTHHVRMTNGEVTAIANGYHISGMAAVTSNGSLAGFSPSPLTIEITGGSAVSFSNVKVTFGGGAAGHFGAEPLEGVVRSQR